jgi:hypothetical protein
MNRLALIACFSSLLFACGYDAQELSAEELKSSTSSGSGTRTKGTTSVAPINYALRTSSSAGSTVWTSAFPLSSTYDVHLALDFPSTVTGHHRATLELRTPYGDVYQRIDVAFATDVAAGAGELQAQAISGGWRLWFRLPVAGTFIDQYQLTGSWSGTAFYDAGASSVATNTFSIY